MYYEIFYLFLHQTPRMDTPDYIITEGHQTPIAHKYLPEIFNESTTISLSGK